MHKNYANIISLLRRLFVSFSIIPLFFRVLCSAYLLRLCALFPLKWLLNEWCNLCISVIIAIGNLSYHVKCKKFATFFSVFCNVTFVCLWCHVHFGAHLRSLHYQLLCQQKGKIKKRMFSRIIVQLKTGDRENNIIEKLFCRNRFENLRIEQKPKQ